MSTERINDLLAQSKGKYTPLQKLLIRSASQRAWTAELRALIPEPLCYEVEITDIRGPQAHLLCRSAAAATRIRFMSDELITGLNNLSSFAEVRELTFRIARSAS